MESQTLPFIIMRDTNLCLCYRQEWWGYTKWWGCKESYIQTTDEEQSSKLYNVGINITRI